MNTRIAPSPTGRLHVGTQRCLYHNWLAARASGGSFVIRIDDTDLARNDSSTIRPIFDWVRGRGLDFDGTFTQSSRVDSHKRVRDDLLKSGKAYWDGECCRLHESAVKPELLTWEDEVTGKVKISDRDVEAAEDMVLWKSNGTPAYNFATVVDDVESQIDHVIRGVDHIPNTGRQALLFRLLGARLPRFSHVGMVCNEGGKVLSKRDSDAVDLSEYDSDAVLNWLLRMGWAPREDNKKNSVLDRERSLELFLSGGKLRSSPARLDMPKLAWYNKKHQARKKETVK